MTNNLNGHSGCILELVNQNKKNIIIKKSNSLSYNKRLEIQYNKQKTYSAKQFHSVEVIDKGIDESGLFWFSMEYINGMTLADYMKTAELTGLKNFAKIFLSIIPNDIIYDTHAKEIFETKIRSLSETIIDKSEVIESSLLLLENYSWNYIQHSPCHGDLTLENILISNNSLHLIDFLDSFYDSWQIDIAKILQDIEIFWHYRKERIDNNLFVRLLVLRKIIKAKILILKDGEKIMGSIYHVLLLNLLRIFPYTKDEYTYDFLQNQLIVLNNKICSQQWRK
jgi:hypothetical protein